MSRHLLLPVIGLLACYVQVPGGSSFESGTGGTTASNALTSNLDIPVARVPREDMLDLPSRPNCQLLDILFVIDNSGSMSDEQTSLAATAPSFVASLQDLGYGWDLHVGVVSTDEYEKNPQECRSIGALVRTCGDTSRPAYLTEQDLELFPCVFDVGADGSSSEKQVESLVAALLPSQDEAPEGAWPGSFRTDECNKGFRRQDAGLVIILITDEEDLSSDGGPDDWVLQVEYLVGDAPVLLIGIISNAECGDDSPRLEALFGGFPSTLIPVCSPAYDFEDTLQELQTECGPVSPEK